MSTGDSGWNDPVPLPTDTDSGSGDPAGRGPMNRNVLLIAGGAAVVVIVVLVLVLGGGGGSSTHHDTGGTLTHAQLVRAANAICAQTSQEQAADAQNAAATADDAESGDNRLRALKPPPADAATLRQYIADIDGASGALRSNDSLTFNSDVASAHSLASQLGFTECAAGDQSG